jgi:hypothetical protein
VPAEKAQLNFWEDLAPIQKRVGRRVNKKARQKLLIIGGTCACGCACDSVNLSLRRNNRCARESGGSATPCEPTCVITVQVTRHHVAQAIWIRT